MTNFYELFKKYNPMGAFGVPNKPDEPVVKDVYSEEWHKGFQMGLYAGKSDEQERIIKLLEAKADQAMRAGQGKPMPERMEYLAVEVSIRQVIALIKGENK